MWLTVSKMTARQRELARLHGTPLEFRVACLRAVLDCTITPEEMQQAVANYESEWREAGELVAN